MFTKCLSQVWLLGKRDVILDRRVCAVIGVGGFILSTALGAYARIYLPFTPVPITLQTFFVLLSGAVLGKKLGGISQAGYVILGGIGLPLFAGMGGIEYLFGPTGGYLIGFIVASWVIGKMLERRKNFLWINFSFLTRNIIDIYNTLVHIANMGPLKFHT